MEKNCRLTGRLTGVSGDVSDRLNYSILSQSETSPLTPLFELLKKYNITFLSTFCYKIIMGMQTGRKTVARDEERIDENKA
jgi:hypothetical protein